MGIWWQVDYHANAIAALLSTSLLAPPRPSVVYTRYLKEWAVYKLTISGSVYLFILMG